MRVGPAVRDAALFAPLILAMLLFLAFVTKEAPHAYLWIAAAAVIAGRFLLVTLGVFGRRDPA